MKIYRRRSPRFAVMPQEAADDTRLSYRARGVLLYLLSRPPNWSTDADRIAAAGKEGRDAIRTALRELEDCGYLIRTRRQLGNGQWVTECEVLDTPAAEDGFPGVGKPAVGKPAVGFPDVGFPDVGFPGPLPNTEPSTEPSTEVSTEPRTETENPPAPGASAPGEPCAAHARSLGRQHRNCRGCGTAGTARCDPAGEGRLSDACRRGEASKCAAAWCQCRHHRRAGAAPRPQQPRRLEYEPAPPEVGKRGADLARELMASMPAAAVRGNA